MITNIDQALSVQSRRFNSGKKGLSKSVRRWYRRSGYSIGKTPSMEANCDLCKLGFYEIVNYDNCKLKG